MLISKFDLCKPEWIELVFAKRNKEYGAYYLRQHYAENVIKAMGITFFSIVGAAIFLGIIIRANPELPQKMTEVIITPYIIPPVAPPKKAIPKQSAPASKPVAPVTTEKYTPMEVVPDRAAVIEPPKLSQLTGPIGPVEIKVPGSGTAMNVDADAGKGGIGNAVAAPNNEIHPIDGLDVMPEPYDGAAGWNKFLTKNMKYPPEASEKNISGKVFISFVIEKDGHLSNIMINRSVGFGMDEEALRVLKLSKAWKPGMQNGQPVRVRYIIPINFTISQ